MVPESCPKIALRCETGMMGMKWRICTAKIMHLVRIKSQDRSSLSRKVFEESNARGWPGLGDEVSQICREIEIPDVKDVCVNKEDKLQFGIITMQTWKSNLIIQRS